MTRIETHEAYGSVLNAAKKEKRETAVLRYLCLSDLFFLLVRVCGRTDLDTDWHFERCMDVQREPDGCVDVWPREHGKSSIITFGKTVQDILANPEERFGFFSNTRPLAKDHLMPIMYEFEENSKLKALFPDILYANPKRQARKLSLIHISEPTRPY